MNKINYMVLTILLVVGCSSGKMNESATKSADTYGVNLISCASQESFDCSFNEFYLDSTTYPHEMQFEIDASFQCGAAGHPQDYFVGFLSGSDQVFTEMPRFGRDGPGHQTIIAKGKGPLKFHDSDKNWTRGNPKYERDCSVVIHRIVGRDLSDASKSKLRDLVEGGLRPLDLDYSRIASNSSLISVLETSFSKLDLGAVKNIFTNFRSNLEAIKVTEASQLDWSPVFKEIDLVLALNPSVDPEDKSHLVIEKALGSIRGNNDALLKSIAMRIGKLLADADEILMFARDGSLADERAVVDTLKKQVVR